MSKVKEARQALGMAQHEVAEKVGTSAMILSTIENDKALPIPSDMDKLCAVLGKTVGELYTRAETSFGRRDYRTGNTAIANLCVRVPRDFKEQFINDTILAALGYESFKDWVMDMARETRQKYNELEGIRMTTMWYEIEVKVEVFNRTSLKSKNRIKTQKTYVEFEVFDDNKHNDEIAKIMAKRRVCGNFAKSGEVVARVLTAQIKRNGVKEKEKVAI